MMKMSQYNFYLKMCENINCNEENNNETEKHNG